MPFDSHRQYLTPTDMAMLERVLAEAGFRKQACSTTQIDAAKFLTTKFQEGVVDETALMSALIGHLLTTPD